MTAVGRWAAAGALIAGVASLAAWTAAWTQTPTAVEPVQRPAAAQAAGERDRATGAALFRAKGCASCHTGPDSVSPMGVNYPSLRDASSWAGDRRPGMTAAEYLLESIAAPGAFISPAFSGDVGPGSAMPQLGLDADEIDAIVGYLLGPGDAGE